METQIFRLQAEAAGEFDGALQFSDSMLTQSPTTVAAELELFEARKRSLAGQMAILSERVKQRQQELSEVDVNINRADL